MSDIDWILLNGLVTIIATVLGVSGIIFAYLTYKMQRNLIRPRLTISFQRKIDSSIIGDVNNPIINDEVKIFNSTDYIARDVQCYFKMLIQGVFSTKSIHLYNFLEIAKDINPHHETIHFRPEFLIHKRFKNLFNNDKNTEIIWKISYQDEYGKQYNHNRWYYLSRNKWLLKETKEYKGDKCPLFEQFNQNRTTLDWVCDDNVI